MSSSDIAAYLYEVGSNERKLEYCRQILASNPSFVPESIFNLNASQLRSTISKGQFVDLVKSLSISSTQQEIELTFSYFQLDGKSYITLDEFVTLITPHADPSLRSLISRRSADEFSLDYSLRYSLQKFFFQIIENQVRLELLCKFTFEKENEDKRTKHRKVTGEAVREFLGHHGKFPSQAEISLILKEMALNKGECKRNRLIGEFIIAYNDRKRDSLQLPKVFPRELTAMADISKKYQSTVETQQQKIANLRIEGSPSKIDKSQSKANPLVQLQYNQMKESGGKGPGAGLESSISNVYQVQDRIKSLMGSININSMSSSKKPQQQTHQPIAREATKEDPRKEQQKSINSKNKSVSRKLQFKPQTIIGEIYSVDNRSEYREATQREGKPKGEEGERNKTERVHYQRNKRITEDNLESESNASSRVEVRRGGKGESRKRMEYLRSLIDSSEDKKYSYLRKYES